MSSVALGEKAGVCAAPSISQNATVASLFAQERYSVTIVSLPAGGGGMQCGWRLEGGGAGRVDDAFRSHSHPFTTRNTRPPSIPIFHCPFTSIPNTSHTSSYL